MDGVFSKRHTLVVKGIAVLILCWHHLYWHNVNVPINLQTAEAYDVLVPLTKVCVALFTILSGFGINESFKHSEHTYIQFSFKHIKKLLFNFWWVYVPVFVLSFWFHSSGTPLKIYSAGTSFLKALWNFFMDFYGIRAFIYSPTLNNTWWYIEAVLVFYICFPVFHFIMKKSSALLIAISAIPVILASCNIIWEPLMTTDRELFYILPFVLGMVLSEKRILNKMVQWNRDNKREFFIYTIILLIIFALIRTQIGMITDTLYALAFIMLGISLLTGNSYLAGIFSFLGKHSMNIYFIHSFVYWYFLIGRNFLARFSNIYVKYIVFMIINVILSVVLEKIKELVMSKASILLKK